MKRAELASSEALEQREHAEKAAEMARQQMKLAEEHMQRIQKEAE